MKYSMSMANTKGVICEICSKAPSKYKCPSCLLRYCSVGCFKLHKGDQSCEGSREQEDKQKKKLERDAQHSAEDGEPDIGSADDSDNEDSVNPQVMEKLEHSISVRAMLKNKHLQQMIKGIDSSPDPENVLHESMQIPLFTEFVDVCLGLLEPEEGMETGEQKL